MKRILCMLMVLVLMPAAALCETSIIENPEIIIDMITPSPSPEPVRESFSSEDLVVTLPAGMCILSEEERAGYDAAVNSDIPDAGHVLLLAANEDRSAALSFSILESDLDAAIAAWEASLAVYNSFEEEITLGENKFSLLRCNLPEGNFLLYFLSDGKRLLCVGASGLPEEEIHTMLTGLIF